ncbi:hypothetical protein FQA39_LY02414 [Lamprigera yunnana]|nr:hypothetical protein FQA39_LY02414 [Lamprigera yunnana]
MMMETVIKCLLLCGIKLLSAICFLRSSLNYFKKPQKCPPITNKLLLCSATTLVKYIAEKKVSSETVIDAYISRINEVNPIINAVVEDRFKLARDEAKKIDKMVSSANLSSDELIQKYPLLGLPLTVKESIAVAGCSNAAGKVFAHTKRATEDAPVIKKCKNAGAIILLVSNTPELCCNFECNNHVTGRTCNPYDNRKTPGGSSGGEGALLGAGASLLGIGSDLYGSIRLPAHYCGVLGHKPSPRTVSIKGHFPSCNDERSTSMINVGPMVRYAEDLSYMLNVIVEEEYRAQLNLTGVIDMKTVNFFYTDYNTSILTRNLSQGIRKCMKNVTKYLNTAYPDAVKKVELAGFKDAAVSSSIKLFSLENIEGIFFYSDECWYDELWKFITRKSWNTFDLILVQIVKRLYRVIVPKRLVDRYEIEQDKFLDEITNVLGYNGVLIYPCAPRSTHFHNQYQGEIFDYSMMGIFNCLGLPVTTCPIGVDSSGMPVGVQIVAARNNDRLSLAVAKELQQAFGGWSFPIIITMEIGVRLLGAALRILNFFLYPLYLYRSLTTKKKLAPIKNDLLRISATKLAQMIRKKQVLSKDVVQIYINRIKEVNEVLNAVVEDRFSAALIDAENADRLLESSKLSEEEVEREQPLLGVPVTIKESCGLAGLSGCVGSLSRKDIKASEDGVAVSMLKAAGAIPLVASNTPELCLNWETSNFITGTTCNVYNSNCTSGGSSGGEGALLGAGASVIGLGSDIGGSIRIPSMFAGVFGHKPTPGLIPIEGHVPYCFDGSFEKFFVIGPMARYAEDLKLMMTVLTKGNEEVKFDKKIDLSTLKVYFMESIGNSLVMTPVQKEIKDAMKDVIRHLDKVCQCQICDYKFKEMENSPEMSLAVFLGIKDVPYLLKNKARTNGGFSLFIEIFKCILGLSNIYLNTLLMYFMQKVNVFIPRKNYPLYVKKCKAFQEKFTEKLGTTGVFLYPTFPTSTITHGELIPKISGVVYAMIFNALGCPSTHVPLGLDNNRMPIGLQVVAAPNQDNLCLEVAIELEKQFGGWTKCFLKP